MRRAGLFVGVILLAVFGLIFLQNQPSSGSLNGEKADMSNYYHLQDDDPAFIEVSMAESHRLFKNKMTGVILYSYEDCPFCNLAVPILNEAAKENDYPVYYVNVYNEELMNLPRKERVAIQEQMMQDIDEVLDVDENGEPELLVPLVIAVKHGKIIESHTSLVDNFAPDDISDVMSDEQNARLKEIYIDLIHSVQD